MNKTLIILVLGIMILLTACAGQSTASPDPTTILVTQPVEEPVVTQLVQEPVETIAPDFTYPAPAVIPFNPLPNAYPGPVEDVNTFIDWTRFEELLMSGQVAKVYHNATLHITLELKDGSMALALEPSLNEFLAVIERCGDPCKDIETIEE
jgi:ABC-type glycerol-3-phosphate transport system substrate-binding protein